MSKYIAKVWRDLIKDNSDYVSDQPGIKYRYPFPETPRAETNPRLNDQPWYHGGNFKEVDPSQKTIPQKPRKG